MIIWCLSQPIPAVKYPAASCGVFDPRGSRQISMQAWLLGSLPAGINDKNHCCGRINMVKLKKHKTEKTIHGNGRLIKRRFITLKGTEPADIIIYIREKGIILKEKSLLAYNTATNKILAVGTDAERIEKENLENVMVVSPLTQGKIADYGITVELLACLLHKAWGKKPLRKPPIGICVPAGMTEVEKTAMEEALHEAGAKEIFMTAIPWKQLLEILSESSMKYHRFKTFIGITKDEPERYITEQLSGLLHYAKQEGIPAQRVAEILQNMDEEE